MPVESTEVRRRPRDRRESLVTAAGDLFREHGYNGVSMEMIGAAVGISGPGVYKHFPRKEAILLALFERFTELRSAEFATAIADKGPPADVLRRMMEGQLRLVLDHGHLADVYLREMDKLPKDAHERFVARRRRLITEQTKLLCGACPKLTRAEARVRLLAVSFGLVPSISQLRTADADTQRYIINAAMAALLAPPA